MACVILPIFLFLSVSGFTVTQCVQDCQNGKSHYHCPYCAKTILRKPDFINHCRKCNGEGLGKGSKSVDGGRGEGQKSQGNSTRSGKRAREEKNTGKGEGSESGSASVSGTGSDSRQESSGVTGSCDQSNHSVPGDVSVSDSCATVDPEASDDSSFVRDTVPCAQCKGKFHKRYMRDHIRRMHSDKVRPPISQKRHHFSTSIDSGSGLFAVYKTMCGTPHPIHVFNKTTGNSTRVECESSDCCDMAETESRSGNPGYHCDHVKSCQFAVAGKICSVSSEALSKMTAEGFLSETRQLNCNVLYDSAQISKTNLLVEIPSKPGASQRFTFFSVFSGTTRWWSVFQRTIVTIDNKNGRISCRCRLRSCEHRSVVRWWLYQQGELKDCETVREPDPPSDVEVSPEEDRAEVANDQDLSGEEEVSDDSPSYRYPPIGQQLTRMVEYMYSEKSILPETVTDVDYHPSKVPERLVPSEDTCFYCKVPLGSPRRVTRRASVINLASKPTVGIETYCKYCPDCGTPYRYQEIEHGIFNYDDRLLVSIPVMMEFRSALVNHTAVNRVVSMMEYRLGITLNHQDMLNAYLTFEAMIDHGYEFSCVRCGYHPKVLVHDLTKKAVFKFEAGKAPVPEDTKPTVDADQFWSDVHKDIIARGVVRGGNNPFRVPACYEKWAPYIGPQTRGSRFLYNTEYEKVTRPETGDHNPVPDEVITHLLADEKLENVRRFCRILGLKAEGSKLDMLCRLRDKSLSKAKFDHAYTKLYGHSGGWLSSTCPHNITYAVKFLLRSESPRDYVDILRSMKHVPTVNIADIAHSIAKMGNRIVPGMFSPNEGCLAEPTEDNIESAQNGTLKIDLPCLRENQPSHSPDAHPLTGSSEHYMLFDWFHQENCKQPSESLRRASLVKQLAGRTNTQAAEQLHSEKAKDTYWLNMMSPFQSCVCV